MLYRDLGQTGEKVSILGFGCMRFPTINGKDDQIDKEKTAKMLSYGIDNGINFIDTAYSYHGTDFNKGGMSEPFLGEFLSTGYREKVLLSTKLPSWIVEKKEDMEYFLDQQLKRLQTDHIDLYLLHSLKEDYWKNLTSLDVFEFMDSIQSDGRVKYIGFSFHDELELLLEILDSYDWDVVFTQMNYLDESYQSGLNGLQYLSSIGLGNVVMEPLRGGKLVNNVPPEINELWNTAKTKRSNVEWAFKYLWDIEGVTSILSGMSTLDQVKENIALASNGYPNSLTKEEKILIKEVSMAYKEKKDIDCTLCGYCMPCPYKVDIPTCFKEYNIAKMLDNVEASSMQYFSLLNEENLASSCTDCGNCVNMCPQRINIPKELKKVKKLFGK
ncbi:L-glyceraldehyde 3-phosphate reductase [Methanobrevibacter cuticularis]|uniref:L-glyceraldehyde 3-phosphate reductase n=1 Tax=Methanobrevibacter cuticularis TaxID=47311 RepID=A0A166DYT4_9EURY|nr:aldo/keto reductase [Methanobrevibacter cuticularis]KZX16095.1 L-glyceraldehyde 3-phosphate reductase [Methanobrevibacter cuticularis]